VKSAERAEKRVSARVRVTKGEGKRACLASRGDGQGWGRRRGVSRVRQGVTVTQGGKGCHKGQG
jgi:hypothetical protein